MLVLIPAFLVATVCVQCSRQLGSTLDFACKGCVLRGRIPMRMIRPAARCRHCAVILCAALVLPWALASPANTGPTRTCKLVSGEVHTTRRPTLHARRSLSEGGNKESEQLWLLGFNVKEEQSLHATLVDKGMGQVLHPVPDKKPDDHHWVVRATSSNLRRLLEEHTDATAAPMPYESKLSPRLNSVLRKAEKKTANAAVETGHITEAEALQAAGIKQHKQVVNTAEHKLPTTTGLHAAGLRGTESVHTLYGLAPGSSAQQLQLMRTSVQAEVASAALTAAAQALAAQPHVTYVDVQHRMVPHNLHANAIIQSPDKMDTTPPPEGVYKGIGGDFFPFWKAGLTGEGQVVGIIDTGIDMDSCFMYDPSFNTYQNGSSTHAQPLSPFGLPGNINTDSGRAYGPITGIPNITVFQNSSARKVVQYVFWSDRIDADGHGTHVATTIAGSAYGMDSLNQPLVATGIAPMAKLSVFDVGGTNETGGANDYLDLFTGQDSSQMYEIQRQAGVRITSNSWGADTYEYSAPDCYLFDAYTHAIDDTLHVFSAGNQGQDTSYLQTSGTVGSPGSCKNVLTVAATENWVPNGIETNTLPFNLLTNNYTIAPVNNSIYITPNRTKGAIQATIGKLMFYTQDGSFNLTVDGDQQQFFLMDGFDSSLKPLLGKKVQVVATNPADACKPSVLVPATSNITTMAVVRKVLPSDTQGCYGRVSLESAMAAGADAVLMFWSDQEDIITSAAPDMAGKSYPSATTSRKVGIMLLQQLQAGKVVWVDVVYGEVQVFNPKENIAWFSSFASAAPYGDEPSADFTNDVRIKPELAAPGYLVSGCSDGKFTGKMDQCSAIVLKGTSMAAPVTAGSAALARQYFMDGFYPTGRAYAVDGFEPSAFLLKAALIAGTVAMTGISVINNQPLAPPPSPFQGYGRLDLSQTLPLEEDDRGWRLQLVDRAVFTTEGVEHSYVVRVPDQCCNGTKPLIATLAYHDYPAFPNNKYVLVNNLDLVIQGPLAADNSTNNMTTTYWGNNRQGGDYRNNVEKVYIPAPEAGLYKISVRAVYVFTGSRPQQYALVVLGGFRGNMDSPFNPAIANRQERKRRLMRVAKQ